MDRQNILQAIESLSMSELLEVRAAVAAAYKEMRAGVMAQRAECQAIMAGLRLRARRKSKQSDKTETTTTGKKRRKKV